MVNSEMLIDVGLVAAAGVSSHARFVFADANGFT